jgi:hypothetical protein
MSIESNFSWFSKDYGFYTKSFSWYGKIID